MIEYTLCIDNVKKFYTNIYQIISNHVDFYINILGIIMR